MARSKLDEHKLREVNLEVLPIGDRVQGRARSRSSASTSRTRSPTRAASRSTCPLGTVLFTGDYKFDQTPVGGAPADMARLAEMGRERLLLLCGDSTNADRPGVSDSESIVGPNLERVFHHCKGRIVVTCFASNIHRVQQVVDAAAANGRKVALLGRSMRKNVNIGRSLGHIDVPEGMLVQPRETDQFPDEKLVDDLDGLPGRAAERAAADGVPRPPAGRAQARRHRRLLRHADPGQRARGQRDDRPALPDRLRRRDGPRRPDPRLRPRLRRRS